MVSRPEFQEIQYQLSSHIRDPEHSNAPKGIEERRLTIYRELIFNNIAGFVESGFPVIHSILNDEEWKQLIREFLVNYRAKSPYFAEVAKEFLSFAQTNESTIIANYPFFQELAHYEWVELALMIDPCDLKSISTKASVDLMNEVPILSPLAWPLAYQFDVHHISKDYQPAKAPDVPSFIVVYRDKDDDVEFIEVNGVTFNLLTIMQKENGLTGDQILKRLSDELPQVPLQAIFEHGLDTMLKLMKKDIILGVASH